MATRDFEQEGVAIGERAIALEHDVHEFLNDYIGMVGSKLHDVNTGNSLEVILSADRASAERNFSLSDVCRLLQGERVPIYGNAYEINPHELEHVVGSMRGVLKKAIDGILKIGAFIQNAEF